VKTRTSKAFGAVAGIAAIALSIPLAVNAYADPPAQPTEIQNPYPDLQGPGCDAFKAAVPNYKAMANLPVGQVLAGIPDVSTFNAALSGGFNPAVNVIPVLENGPYVVFAPTDQAFGALDPAQLEALKADPAALFDFDYYHAFLGLLGVDDVHGQRPTQQGAEIKVDGKGGDIKVNGAKVLCGAIQASNARIYLIDTVLDKSEAPEPVTPSGTSSTSTTTTTTTTSATPEPLPAADAPIG
jgi:uncharacterized surface protein with fasciclin (FAS1) repeats